MISGLIAASSLLFAVGSSGSRSPAVARFILEHTWYKPGTKITLSSARFNQAKNQYASDPGNAIETLFVLGIDNRLIAEALLNGKLKHHTGAKNIVFIVPRPADLVRGWVPRPIIFYALRSLAIRWRDGIPFGEHVFDERPLPEEARPIQDKAEALVEWAKRKAKPRIEDVILAVKHIEWLLEQEKGPLVNPKNIQDPFFSKASANAREWAVRFRTAWST